MGLDEYRKKRRFGVTPEPSGDEKPARKSSKGKSATPKPGTRSSSATTKGKAAKAAGAEPLGYVIQKHRATALHYDFRLEWNGVLLSWAVPKGPSLDPSVKRMAMPTEDHPIAYAAFEGIIPEGEYGGGTVMVWDNGTWEPEVADVDAAMKKGDLKFTLHGKKLQGSWVLVRLKPRSGESRAAWLLIKHRDEFAAARDIAEEEPRSVVSDRILVEIARDEGGDLEKAASGDPPSLLRKLARDPKLVTPPRRGKKKSVWRSNRPS